MTEIAPQLERPQFQSPEKKKSFARNAKTIVKRLFGRSTNFSARPASATAEPLQRINPAAEIEKAKMTDPERAIKMSESGCAVRAIMSAVAHATGIKSITATAEEWWARLHQMEAPLPPDVHQELIDLYKDYANSKYTKGKKTDLSKALEQAKVDPIEPQNRKQIKARIQRGEQVMIIIDEEKKKRTPHILHLGLDNKGRFISLSDEKEVHYKKDDKGQPILGKDGQPIQARSRYQRPKLSHGTFTTFTVTPETKQKTQKELALAA